MCWWQVCVVYIIQKRLQRTEIGSSVRNFMIYQRPTVQSLDKWAEEVGDKSWVRPSFQLLWIMLNDHSHTKASYHTTRRVWTSLRLVLLEMEIPCTAPQLLKAEQDLLTSPTRTSLSRFLSI